MKEMKAKERIEGRPTFSELPILIGLMFKGSLHLWESKVFPGRSKKYAALMYLKRSAATSIAHPQMHLPENYWQNFLQDFPQAEPLLKQLRKAKGL